jgi:hypothetical protein
VRGKNDPEWLVLQTSPSSKIAFLRNLLARKFPSHRFHYKRFLQRDLKVIALKNFDGIILEMKILELVDLRVFDQVCSLTPSMPRVLILSPASYRLLLVNRPESLESSLVILSDLKSLDYILQLPRVIEEIGRRKRLKIQNERLQRLIDQKLPDLGDEELEASVQELLAPQSTSPLGLKVKVLTWTRLKRNLSQTAREEVLDLLNRLIHGSVRNGDRILRSGEGEFLVFLAGAKSDLIARCRERLQRAFRAVKIQANAKALKLTMRVRSLEIPSEALV